MTSRGKNIIWAATAGFIVGFPLALLAYEYGPDPRYTGAPGDAQLACASVGCHTGSNKGGPLNSAGGSVTATFSSGTTYTPGGPPITITVSVSDPANKHFGFQMTARLESDLANGQAGDFTAGPNQVVTCDQMFLVKPSTGCPSNAQVQFIEHDYPSGSQVSTTPYTFTWTPPATNVGNVHFYVAGNAVNGNLQADSGDHVYTNAYVLTPAAAGYTCTNTTPPVITSITSIQGYGGYNYFASGSWLEILGSNLADPNDPRMSSSNPGLWTTSDFNGANAPTSLDGISVSVNNKPAFVEYISPTQINVQAPEDSFTGNAAITVTNCKATSNATMVQKQAFAPGMLTPSNFNMNGTQYMVATIADPTLPLGYAFVGQTTWFAGSGYSVRPAKPGDTVVLYGIGFGDVQNATILPGVIVSQGNTLVNPVSISFGSTPANIVFQGLAGSYVGLYEFYVTVPNVANGDYQINMTQNGTKVPQTMYLTVHN